MPKRRRSSRNPERGPRRPARSRSAPGPDLFDEAWLTRFREFSRARYVDLTSVEDRRRWNPNSRWAPAKNVLGLRTRVVVVPEKHRLARFATYGMRVPLSHLYKYRNRKYAVRSQRPEYQYDRYGGKQLVTSLGVRTVPKRIGFHMPWQVIICVRRRRRREVMHALGVAGSSGAGRAPKRHNAYSEVVC